MIFLLIAKGADINVKINANKQIRREKDGKTVLHFATEKSKKEIVELLISKGADVNVKDMNY